MSEPIPEPIHAAICDSETLIAIAGALNAQGKTLRIKHNRVAEIIPAPAWPEFWNTECP